MGKRKEWHGEEEGNAWGRGRKGVGKRMGRGRNGMGKRKERCGEEEGKVWGRGKPVKNESGIHPPHRCPALASASHSAHLDQWASIAHLNQRSSIAHLDQWPSTAHLDQWSSIAHLDQRSSIAHLDQWPSIAHLDQWPSTAYLIIIPVTAHLFLSLWEWLDRWGSHFLPHQVIVSVPDWETVSERLGAGQ